MHGGGESFITRYIFSQDHKMIARQFLVTGMIWAVICHFHIIGGY